MKTTQIHIAIASLALAASAASFGQSATVTQDGSNLSATIDQVSLDGSSSATVTQHGDSNHSVVQQGTTDYGSTALTATIVQSGGSSNATAVQQGQYSSATIGQNSGNFS